MNPFDQYGGSARATLQTVAAITSTTNSTGVDLRDFAGIVTVTLVATAGTGTSPTLAVKLQDSADNSTFADISGAAFTTVTDAAVSVQHIGVNLDSCARYVRAVSTVGGSDTPTFTRAVLLQGFKPVL